MPVNVEFCIKLDYDNRQKLKNVLHFRRWSSEKFWRWSLEYSLAPMQMNMRMQVFLVIAAVRTEIIWMLLA